MSEYFDRAIRVRRNVKPNGHYWQVYKDKTMRGFLGTGHQRACMAHVIFIIKPKKWSATKSINLSWGII